MIRQLHQVKYFHEACGVEMPTKPTLLPKQLMLDRASWILEELVETMKASTIEDQADGLIDAMYFIIGTFTLMGLDPEPIFEIVARANLGKIQNGVILRDEQGKIRKPEGWYERYAPEAKIREEIARQASS